jgi:hypothetical protein
MADLYAVLGNFLEALYEAEGQYNRPLVVFMEETHVLIPEIGRVRLPGIKKLQDKVIYWAWEIAARGRHRGLGYVCIARRAAEVAKAVLSQCPTRFIFKLVDPVDLAWLRESGFTKEEIGEIQRLPKGVAFVRGLTAEHIKVRCKERFCSHGGKTPIAKAVETPELESAIKDLSKIVKAPPIVAATVPEQALKRIDSLEAERKRLLGKVRSLESRLSEEMAGKEALSLEAERLRARIKQLESRVLTDDEKSKLIDKVQTLEGQVSELEGRLAETQRIAVEFEEKFEKIRQLWGDWADLIVETADHLDLELIPKDVRALQEERDRYKAELETYKREEELRKELFQQTLEDPNIRSWIRDAEAFLQDLKRRGQAGSAVLKASLRMDPEVTFLPEEIQTGYTQSTNATYMKMLEAKGLLWEASKKGRKAFRNRFPYWVAENIRKIRPNAPDGAIDEIVDRLKRSVIG